MIETLTREDFEACGASEYRLETEADGVLRLELAECVALPGGQPGRRAPFSIVFRGPPAPLLPQRIYRLENDELGALEIFLVPVGSNAEATEYEAVFT